MGNLITLSINRAEPRTRDYKLADRDGLYLLIRPAARSCGASTTDSSTSVRRWPSANIPRWDYARCAQSSRMPRAPCPRRDPMAEAEKVRALALLEVQSTFEAVAEEWYKKCEDENLVAITLSKIRWLLEMAYPMLARKLMTEITLPGCIAVLRKLEAPAARERASDAQRARTRFPLCDPHRPRDEQPRRRSARRDRGADRHQPGRDHQVERRQGVHASDREPHRSYRHADRAVA